MELRALLNHPLPALRTACTAALALSFALTSDPAFAQSDDTRILWQLDFDTSLSKNQQSQIQNTVIQTLSRAKERHFVGDNILAQKIKKEGLSFPECFESGMPCSAGGAFILDVHNVDAFANARFSKPNDEWVIDLELYRSMSTSAIHVSKSGPSLPDLMQILIGSLFELESAIEISSSTPGVEVYINSKLIGTTPVNIKTSVGPQTIVFKKDGYVSETWNFEAEKGKIYTRSVELKPEETQLTILTSAQDAQIYIDGDFWGSANQTDNILPGNHIVEVKSDTHHTYSQNFTVYPGAPQTMQVASLPLSRSPYEIRQLGIQKYRLAATVGYHLATQTLSMPDASIDGFRPDFKTDVVFNGISMAFSYESQYWGLNFLRLDIAGASASGTIELEDGDEANAKSAFLFGLYPAQIKVHAPFWVMQMEAAFALGFAYTKLSADSFYTSSFDLTQKAFSIDLSLDLKYFFSEESFIMVAYDLQVDAARKAQIRNGMTIALGFQFPVWMRNTQDPDFGDDSDDNESQESSDDSEEQDDIFNDSDNSSDDELLPDLEDL